MKFPHVIWGVLKNAMLVQERYLGARSERGGRAATAAAAGPLWGRGPGGRQHCGRLGWMTNILQSVTARPWPARNWMRCRRTESFVISVDVRMGFFKSVHYTGKTVEA